MAELTWEEVNAPHWLGESESRREREDCELGSWIKPHSAGPQEDEREGEG